jgi:hypothetical protein
MRVVDAALTLGDEGKKVFSVVSTTKPRPVRTDWTTRAVTGPRYWIYGAGTLVRSLACERARSFPGSISTGSIQRLSNGGSRTAIGFPRPEHTAPDLAVCICSSPIARVCVIPSV